MLTHIGGDHTATGEHTRRGARSALAVWCRHLPRALIDTLPARWTPSGQGRVGGTPLPAGQLKRGKSIKFRVARVTAGLDIRHDAYQSCGCGDHDGHLIAVAAVRLAA